MANLQYQHYSDNMAPSATVAVNTGTEDAAYPAANLKDRNPARPGKLTTTTGSWTFNFVAAQRVDIVALLMHNLAAGLSVRIQGNATNAWGAPTFDQAITIPTYREDGFPINPWLDLTTLAGYSAAGFAWWRIVVVGVNAAAVAIGDVWLGKLKRTLSPNINWGETQDEDRRLIEHSTDHGVDTIYDLGVTRRSIIGEVDAPDATRDALRTWWRDSRGRAQAFLIMPDGAVNDAWLVRWTEAKQAIRFDLTDRNTVQLNFLEVSRGLVL